MNADRDPVYDRWLEHCRETAVPEGFADRVMQSVARKAASPGPHPEGWVAGLTASRGRVLVMATAAGIALLVRLLAVSSRFVDSAPGWNDENKR